ncbi:hypothetical protein ACX27_25670 [Nostoc piscinale CENA21]|uniref:DUF4279 domain-containing protein n=1 Tax=Nostoc piscinale CENA21 TaxID=224013 RepID=A0A0M4TNU2_9NOSO|nr:DUF4279 domain-containing protein [Nostoc piscinale]ALF55449.1 hypothetical protein ACX27_25670 [Nostoc piscinale CENA21]
MGFFLTFNTSGVYRVKRCAGVSLEYQINTLFDQLPVDLGIWHKLTTKFDADLFCGLWLKQWNRGLDFSPQTLQRISDRGLSLSLDIYFNYDEKES